MRAACLMVQICVLCSAIRTGSSHDVVGQQNAQANLFDFHSGFWINLHHFLYREGQLSELEKRSDNLDLGKADSDELERLSSAERGVWHEAVSYYGRFLVKHDLTFDDELIRTKNRLEDAEGSSDLANVTISADLKAVLLKAAPLYRKHWWKRHSAENQGWIAYLEPLVERYGPILSARMTKIYEQPWPQFPVRVDAVTYANGAYTTLEPTRLTISTTDPGNESLAALETLFHETSHGMTDKVRNALSAAESDLNAHRSGAAFHSGSIWHAVLFYTDGVLMTEQIPGYISYADKSGLWVRGWPPPDRSLIEKDWKPHIDGPLTLQQSLTKLVKDLAAASSSH